MTRELPTTTTAREDWHDRAPEDVVLQLATDRECGLDHCVAADRLNAYGPNDVLADEERRVIAIFLAQLTDFMIVILLVAAAISAALGELGDALVIATIVAINAIVGAVQEVRARRALKALKKMSAPAARVVRGGGTENVPAEELVPGDIVLLEAGNIVPADLRLLDVHELSADESMLTGEAMPVKKQVAALEAGKVAVGDRRNMAFRSTSVTKGRGMGVVVATGMRSEIGRIARLLERRDDLKTPLQQRLAAFGRRLAAAIVAICAVVFGLGLVNGEPPMLMFLTAVSLAVAAIPEALPAVVTIALALGAKKLSRKRSLVRQLPAVETLGSVTCICTDKTGTLTQNRMAVARVLAADQARTRLADIEAGAREKLGAALALCNDVAEDDSGDPTEVALVRAAGAAGFDKASMLERLPRIGEIPFDSERKLMTTLHRAPDGPVAFVKGAPEAVLALCCRTLDARGHTRPFEPDAEAARASALAERGYRVLAIAYRDLPEECVAATPAEAEAALTYLGLVALEDPLRPEAREAVAACLSAGITPIMITGDHPVTARRVAMELGLDVDGGLITGRELECLSDEQLSERAGLTRVYARVDPEQKIRVVEALQRRGELVAMTGDGVNDAPALKQASIGIAMGQRGTDVAREAADLVLLDDNFATIVTAIREGRRVYDNIRKFIQYTMTSNAGEIWVLLLAPFLGLPVPLLPIHILWINLVTDGLPGLAFSAEPAEADIMRRPPRHPTESVFAQGTWQHVLWMGLTIGGLSLGTSAWADPADDLAHWQTMVFTTLVTAQLFQALALRSERASLLSIGLFTNPYMIGTVAATLAVQLLVIYAPVFNSLLRTTPLPASDLVICLALGFVVLPIVEIRKRYRAR